MTWSYDYIAREMLAGARILVPPDEVVAAFERCERVLGRERIDRVRAGGVTGAAPTLGVVMVGRALAALEDVSGAAPLIARLRNDEASAWGELDAIALLRSSGDTVVELFPAVVVGNRQRQPDFRIRREDEGWVYVEVSRPDTSEAEDHARAIVNDLTTVLDQVAGPKSVEVFLRREPSDVELKILRESTLAFSRKEGPQREELPDGLGVLTSALGDQFVVVDHAGEENRPRLGSTRVSFGTGVVRRIDVRMPFSDERAARFIDGEAGQLPDNSPGLIMVDIGKASGARRSWEPLIRRRFQPSINTRVGGVGLFERAMVASEKGLGVTTASKLMANPHAKIALPPWIESTFATAGAQHAQLMKPAPG
jgi:hypothetical protein